MPSRAEERREEMINLGLIEFLAQHTIDDDYEWIAENDPERGKGRGSVLLALVTVVLFGALVYTAASQTTRNAVTEARDRSELIAQIKDRRAALNGVYAEERRVTAANKVLERRFLSQEGSSLFVRLSTLSIWTGAAPVTGPGVLVTVDDAPHAVVDRDRVLDTDLQKLVNGLWAAGAEAISINGQRISNLSSIREAGGAINLNYRSLKAPYVIRAIGDRRKLQARFAETTSGSSWFDVQRQIGLRFTMVSRTSLTLPEQSDLSLRFATTLKGDGR